jgi:FkbM family methyltransferase
LSFFTRARNYFHRQARRQSVRNLRWRFIRLQKSIRPDTFIEAGAFDARISLAVRRRLPKARIVAFEANPFNFKAFSATGIHARKNVEYIHSAVSSASGTAVFKVLSDAKDGKSLMCSLLPLVDESRTYIDVTVPCTTVDEFFSAGLPARPSLWIDVEGANREVLTGAVAVLERAVCVLIEVEDRPMWAGQWLASDTIQFLQQFGLRPVARDRQTPHQYNILFLKDCCSAQAFRGARNLSA